MIFHSDDFIINTKMSTNNPQGYVQEMSGCDMVGRRDFGAKPCSHAAGNHKPFSLSYQREALIGCSLQWDERCIG